MRLVCDNYAGGGFWSDTFDPGLGSVEPPECGHSFDFELDEDAFHPWTTCPACGGEVYVP